MNILIIPSLFITNYKSRNFQLIKSFLYQKIIKKKKISLKDVSSHFFYAEHYNYSYISKINEEKNTYILGNYYSNYTTELIPEFSRYPSSHKTPKGNHISYNEVFDILPKLDCILVGIKSINFTKKILQQAKKNNIFVAYLDYFDDPEIYNINSISEKRLTRNYKKNIDFDIYFKHDIPLSVPKDYLYSICPMPINFHNYPKIEATLFNKKKFDMSFSGREHNSIHVERVNLLNLLKDNFKKFESKMINPHEKISIKEYCSLMNDTKIAFSPSGKVWDSTRHAECAIYKNVPLIKKPNCQLANNFLVNDDNSINYEINYSENEIIKKQNEILEKINFIANNENQFNKISNNWYNEVLNKNTLEERSKYILKIIHKHLKNA